MKFNEIEYSRPDIAQFCDYCGKTLDQLKTITDAKEFYDLFMQLQSKNSEISLQSNLAHIRHTIDTRDSFYETECEFWDETIPQLQVYSTRLAEIVLDFEDRNELMKYIPEPYFLTAECNKKSFDEKIIPLLQQENKLSTEYGKLKANAQLELDGKTYNLASIGPLTVSDDRETRKKAVDATSKFYKDNEAEFDRIYDELVKVRTEIAHQLGMKNYTELGYYRMTRLDYNREMVEVYRKQILEYIVPLCNKIYKAQTSRLGLDSLSYYDWTYEFTTGNATPKGTSDELVKNAVEMYHQMSEQTGKFIDLMNDNEMWDLLSKDGKEMGGYTEALPVINMPFIFSNFNGTSGDVDVLTHEAGHAFQYYMSGDIKVEDCKWPTMESCEIHSMSMEFFAYPWMENFFKEDCQKYYYSHLTGTIKFLPYGILVDHFQHEVYDHPEMSPEERKATWRRLEKMYIPSKDYTGCDILDRGGYWYRQGHIFGSPFYYIDYCLAQICALQYWVRMYNKDENAFKDYLHLCSLGGSMTFTKLVKEAGLVSPFEEGCVKTVAETVEKYLATVDDSKI